MNRPSRNEPSRFGASRKSSAERDGGVSTTIRSHGGASVAARRAQLAELLHRHVLLRAREGATTATGRRGWPGSARPGPGRRAARRSRRTSASCPASSRRAAARPASTPGTARGVLSSSVEPHRLGQPAGRVDGQHARPCGRARPRAAPAPRPWWSCRRRRTPQQTTIRVAGSVEQRVDVESRPARGRHAHPLLAQQLGQLVQAAEVDAVGQQRQLVRRPAERGRARRARASPAASAGRGRRASASSAVDDVVGVRQPGRASGRRPRVAVQPCPSAAAVSSVGRSSGGRTMFTTTAPTGSPAVAQLRDGVDRLLHRHLLQQGHQVHGGLRRAQQRHDRVGLRLDRPDLGQPGDLGVDVEEAGDPAGRRRVEDDRVVRRGGRCSVRATASYTLPVSSTSRRPGAIVVAKSTAPIRFSARPARPRL